MPITCRPNGPYFVADAALRGADGQEHAVGQGVALCRCGGSKKKPFCDGTHRTNGFSDAKLADPALNRRTTYAGKSVAIHDNRALCAHAGYCTDGLAEVFREDAAPWIDPDGAAAARVVEIVSRCPSGALACTVDGNDWAPPARPPTIVVTRDGPYAVTGSAELVGVTFGDRASTEHYTLCRCGASKNKPFCDGSHWNAGFKDPA